MDDYAMKFNTKANRGRKESSTLPTKHRIDSFRELRAACPVYAAGIGPDTLKPILVGLPTAPLDFGKPGHPAICAATDVLERDLLIKVGVLHRGIP